MQPKMGRIVIMHCRTAKKKKKRVRLSMKSPAIVSTGEIFTCME